MSQLPQDHFLSLPRPDVASDVPLTVVDTTTLAAHDFDVDTRSGFMAAPRDVLDRLPPQWGPWEVLLDAARAQSIQLGDKADLTDQQKLQSSDWRRSVKNESILSVDGLNSSEVLLRRAHQVLTWIMHFYVHSLPPGSTILIPASIGIPLLRVSAQLQLPPVLTYSDTVLYNWALESPSAGLALDNLRSHTLFTNSIDEQEFYLSTGRIELVGVRALELMQASMDEIFVGDDIALERVTTYLEQLATVIKQITTLMLDVRKGCNPETFFKEIRPWFRGVDSSDDKRQWVFESIQDYPELKVPTELSGPSAGQSSLIHALDIFLGVEAQSHDKSLTGSSTQTDKPAFLDRMRRYMPRYHRNFLTHLANNPRPLRALVASANKDSLIQAYNGSVLALKEFRDAHMRIVTLYIIGPANKAARQGLTMRKVDTAAVDRSSGPLKGTGGTELVVFLKGVRDRTTESLITDA